MQVKIYSAVYYVSFVMLAVEHDYSVAHWFTWRQCNIQSRQCTSNTILLLQCQRNYVQYLQEFQCNCILLIKYINENPRRVLKINRSTLLTFRCILSYKIVYSFYDGHGVKGRLRKRWREDMREKGFCREDAWDRSRWRKMLWEGQRRS